MDMLGVVFPTIMYILGSILLVCLIIFVLKSIAILDKTNEILDDVNNKVKSLDNLFSAINGASNVITAIGDGIMDKVFALVNKFGKNKKRKGEDLDE